MSSPQRGDIYWINLDPTIGAEIKKTRPCVIISPNAANRSGAFGNRCTYYKGSRQKGSFSRDLTPERDIKPSIRFKTKGFSTEVHR